MSEFRCLRCDGTFSHTPQKGPNGRAPYCIDCSDLLWERDADLTKMPRDDLTGFGRDELTEDM
jgi:hypothetical protein